ncbi:hypothetical protein HanPSC8_Chr14g0619991 [Helianthus annuus]|nr:hypothetical protein HanPSC8_Chr14g0619991 [Helianthus annuus]
MNLHDYKWRFGKAKAQVSMNAQTTQMVDNSIYIKGFFPIPSKLWPTTSSYSSFFFADLPSQFEDEDEHQS